MRVELMEFKRCCCCIPLRYGLLISGYFKLMVLVAILLTVTTQLVELIKALKWRNNVEEIAPFIIIAITTIALVILLTLGDIAITIVFVIGNHKKNSRLLRIYSNYAVGLLVTDVLALILLIAYVMYQTVPMLGLLYVTMKFRGSLASTIVNICLQVYLIFMAKSEMAKLENNCQFQFTNNANEAQCTMNDVGVNETNTHEAQRTMNDVGVNETNGTCIINSEQVDQNQAVNENEVNYQTKKNLNGNYARFN